MSNGFGGVKRWQCKPLTALSQPGEQRLRELRQEGAEIPPGTIEIWLEKRAKRLSAAQSNRYHGGWDGKMGWEMVPEVRCGGDKVLQSVLLPRGTQAGSSCSLYRVPDMSGRRLPWQGHITNARRR